MQNKTLRYKLCFGPSIQDTVKEVPTLVIEEPDRASLVIDRLTYLSYYNVTLESLLFNRKIYQPGSIFVDIAIERQDKTLDQPSFSEISDALLYRKVDLYIRNDAKASADGKRDYEQIATCYYVHEIYPQLTREGKLNVKLTIYSMDKLMTLNKYSKAYPVKKLSAILSDEVETFGYRDRFLEAESGSMRKLIYLDGTTKYEFIHPYLVQYNESFYDFIVRTANRCGEFFYFEDGKLHLGVNVRKKADGKTDEDPAPINNYSKVTFQGGTDGPLKIKDYVRDSVKNYEKSVDASEKEDLNFNTFDVDDSGYPKDAFPNELSYNSEMANDEYVYYLYKDKFETIPHAMNVKSKDEIVRFFIETGTTVLGDTNGGALGAAELLKDLIYDTSMKAKDGAITERDTNTSDNKDNIEDYDFYIKAEQADTSKVVHFASKLASGWTTVDYLHDVREEEERLKRETICIDMGTNYASVKLGDKIKLSNMSTTYVVIQIVLKSEQDWVRVYDKYDGDSITGFNNGNMVSQKIYAVPYTTKDGEDIIMPPLQSVPYIRKSGPQTAFIVDNSDPKHQGRVRIAFPWQSVASEEKIALYKSAREESAEEEKVKAYTDELLRARAERDKASEFLRYLYSDESGQTDVMGQLAAELARLKKRKADVDTIISNESTFVSSNTTSTVPDGDLSEKGKRLAAKNKAVEEKATLESEIATLEKKSKLTKEEKTALETKKTDLKKKEKEITLCDVKIDLWNKEVDEYKTESSELETKIDTLQAQYDSLKKSNDAIEKKYKDKKAEAEKIEDEEQRKKALDKINQDIEEEKKKAEKKTIEELKEPIKKYIENLNTYIVDKDEERKDQEETAAQAGKVTEKTADLVKKALKAGASPWIRVASPMATQGGGFNFIPNKGDEVLVNFDNDNVERPYVVGSLYSKNLEIPQKMSIVSPNGHTIEFDNPGNGTKVIESLFPALKIWKSSLGFDFFGVPEFMNAKDSSKAYKDGLKSMKDFTGSIHFTDRYGFYDINMCSDKRSISISSPLGKVSMSALQGINISAPNGDVTIEGKNVTIKAGNNLTLSSGGNVRSKKEIAEEVKSIATSIAGKVVKETIGQFTNIIDIELLRTVLEVFVRPVEGTTLIKSKRYLKFEAGKGETMIQRDRYKPGHRMKHHGEEMFAYLMQHAISAIDTGFDKFFDTYAKLKAEAFKKQIVYDDYARTLLRKMDNADNPDVRKKAFTFDTANEWKHGDDCVIKKADYLKEGVLKDSILAFFKNGVHYSCGTADKKAEFMQKVADEYGEAIYNLHKHVLSLGAATNMIKEAILTEEMKKEYHKGWVTMLKRNAEVSCLKADPKATKAAIATAQTAALLAAGTTENGTDYPYSWVDDEASNQFDFLINSDKGYLKKWKDRYGDGDPKDAFLGKDDKETEDDVLWTADEKPLNKTVLKRKFALLLLDAAAKNEEGKKYVSLNYLSNKNRDELQDICKDDAKWEEFVENMDRNPYLFFRGLWDIIGDNFKGLWDKSLPQMAKWRWKDAEHWDDAQGGQILFSDKKNQTIRMEGTELKADEESHKYTEAYYKGLIKGLE